MSNYQGNGGDSNRPSDRRRDYYSPSGQSARATSSKAPTQTNQPQGLNESYYRESAAALGIPLQDEARSRSVPPPTSAMIRRPRSPSSSSSRSSSRSGRSRSYARSYRSVSRDGSRNPEAANQTRGIIQNNFSQTRAGIGAGIIGAVVGGLVAKQASEAAFRHRQKQSGRPRRHSSEAMPRMASAVLGAVAGALGANAITHRLEDARARNKNQQLAWERQYEREEGLPHYDTGRARGLDYRNGKGYIYDVQDYNDDAYNRDWKYDDPRPRRHRIEDKQHY